MATRKTPEAANLPSSLIFDPDWIKDPVPWWIIDILDRNSLIQLAQAKIDLNRAVLKAQIEAADRMSAIIGGKK